LKANLQAYFSMFQMFQRYVASVSYRYCKSRLRCFIRCNGCTGMLQAFVQNVLSVFKYMLQVCLSIYCIYMFDVYVASVLSECCIHFSMAFQVFSGVLQVFQTHVSCVFKHMLQIFYQNIFTTDRLLLLGTHLSQQASGRGSRGGANGLRMGSKGACNIRTTQARTWARVAECRCGRPKARVYPGRWHCHKNNQ
jgi:cation transport ATPase